MTRILSALVLAVLATPAYAWEPSEIPVDAPAACLDSARHRVKRVGVYRLANGKSLDTPRLRLRAYGEFIPERLGSTRGEVQSRFEAAFLPDVDRDGPNPDNSVFTAAPGELRIGTYRVILRTHTTTPLTFDAIVDDIGCPEAGVAPPLAKVGDTRTFWVSTDAVADYAFSTRPWYMTADRMSVTLRTWLDPEVHQKDKQVKTGGITLHLWEGLDGHPTAEELHHDDVVGSKTRLHDHEIEVLRLVWGKDTAVFDGRVVTAGDEPRASLLVRVTRYRVTPRGY